MQEDTIEVPVSLIRNGDITAIRKLINGGNLRGRWASHHELGRVLIMDNEVDVENDLRVSYRSDSVARGTEWEYVNLDDLTIDPAELTTEADFERAPTGSIVTFTGMREAAIKQAFGAWSTTQGGVHDSAEMANKAGACKVVKWGMWSV